jgi:hypothetical protein
MITSKNRFMVSLLVARAACPATGPPAAALGRRGFTGTGRRRGRKALVLPLKVGVAYRKPQETDHDNQAKRGGSSVSKKGDDRSGEIEGDTAKA